MDSGSIKSSGKIYSGSKSLKVKSSDKKPEKSGSRIMRRVKVMKGAKKAKGASGRAGSSASSSFKFAGVGGTKKSKNKASKPDSKEEKISYLIADKASSFSSVGYRRIFSYPISLSHTVYLSSMLSKRFRYMIIPSEEKDIILSTSHKILAGIQSLIEKHPVLSEEKIFNNSNVEIWAIKIILHSFNMIKEENVLPITSDDLKMMNPSSLKRSKHFLCFIADSMSDSVGRSFIDSEGEGKLIYEAVDALGIYDSIEKFNFVKFSDNDLAFAKMTMDESKRLLGSLSVKIEESFDSFFKAPTVKSWMEVVLGVQDMFFEKHRERLVRRSVLYTEIEIKRSAKNALDKYGSDSRLFNEVSKNIKDIFSSLDPSFNILDDDKINIERFSLEYEELFDIFKGYKVFNHHPIREEGAVSQNNLFLRRTLPSLIVGWYVLKRDKISSTKLDYKGVSELFDSLVHDLFSSILYLLKNDIQEEERKQLIQILKKIMLDITYDTVNDIKKKYLAIRWKSIENKKSFEKIIDFILFLSLKEGKAFSKGLFFGTIHFLFGADFENMLNNNGKIFLLYEEHKRRLSVKNTVNFVKTSIDYINILNKNTGAFVDNLDLMMMDMIVLK
ncbi:MAG: hypothetical protein KAH32_01145 [Chlamydiia bacterium]|nr:hypothetical protein [Chlamydiia bacterium]